MSEAKKLYLGQQESTFATNLQRLICEKGISEAELARQTQIPQPTLHKILTGKTSDPRGSTLATLANYFGISIDELFTGAATTHQPIQTETQSVPIISWKDCLKSISFTAKLTPSNWNDWIVTERLAPNAYALVSKLSMQARVPQNSILIIDPNSKPEDGDLIVVHYPGTEEATIRELSIEGPNKLLLPINPEGKPESFDDQITILGVIVQSRLNYNK